MSGFETIKERSKNLLIYGGITAMTGAAMLGLGGSVFAQDAATPSSTIEDVSDGGTVTDRQAEREARYAAFLDALAVNLGVADGETIDAAIRTTLKQMIDERLAAGEISANLADELKAAIDSGDYRVGLHLRGIGRFGDPGFGGRHHRDADVRGHHRDDAIEDDAAEDTLVPTTGTPTAGSDASA